MQASEQIDALAAALAAAQGELSTVGHDRENPHFRSKYATLAALWSTARPALARHGLAVVQGLSRDGDDLVCATRIMHASGQWIESTMSARPSKSDVQAVGSAATYLRRYALAAMVGLASGEEDDDGEAATRPQDSRPPAAPARPARPLADILGDLEVTGAELDAWLAAKGRPVVADLPDAERSKLGAWLDGPGGRVVRDGVRAMRGDS